jgi:hypothetical protein
LLLLLLEQRTPSLRHRGTHRIQAAHVRSHLLVDRLAAGIDARLQLHGGTVLQRQFVQARGYVRGESGHSGGTGGAAVAVSQRGAAINYSGAVGSFLLCPCRSVPLCILFRFRFHLRLCHAELDVESQAHGDLLHRVIEAGLDRLIRAAIAAASAAAVARAIGCTVRPMRVQSSSSRGRRCSGGRRRS